MNNFFNTDNSLSLTPEQIQDIRDSVNSDVVQMGILEDQLDNLEQINLKLESQSEELKHVNLVLRSQLTGLKKVNLTLESQLRESKQTNSTLNFQLGELKQANLTLKSQLDIANENLKKKEEIIFNQNVQIELQKAEYLRQVEETKKQEARAIIAEKEAKKALVREKISYILSILAFFIDHRIYLLSGFNMIKNFMRKTL